MARRSGLHWKKNELYENMGKTGAWTACRFRTEKVERERRKLHYTTKVMTLIRGRGIRAAWSVTYIQLSK